MPNIVYDVKLDFKDVLLRPKRSTLKSRADVDLYREITFRNSKQTYNGIPIMASNMDTVGTFEMATTLAKVEATFDLQSLIFFIKFQHGCFTCMHKFYSAEDYKQFAAANPETVKYVAASSGTGDGDWERLQAILAAVPDIKFICVVS